MTWRETACCAHGILRQSVQSEIQNRKSQLKGGGLLADWLLGGVTFSDPAGMADADGLVAGRYWIDAVSVGAPEHERRLYGFPGVDGQGVKDFGYRGRAISGRVAYVQDGIAALRAAIASDLEALAAGPFSTTPPGESALPHCVLSEFKEEHLVPAGGGLLVVRASVVVRQVRS